MSRPQSPSSCSVSKYPHLKLRSAGSGQEDISSCVPTLAYSFHSYTCSGATMGSHDGHDARQLLDIAGKSCRRRCETIGHTSNASAVIGQYGCCIVTQQGSSCSWPASLFGGQPWWSVEAGKGFRHAEAASHHPRRRAQIRYHFLSARNINPLLLSMPSSLSPTLSNHSDFDPVIVRYFSAYSNPPTTPSRSPLLYR